MKDFLEKFKKMENQTQKTILFFGFYFVFFVLVFVFLAFSRDKNYLNQEYERGNSLPDKGTLSKNFLYDYKIKIDSTLHDYYGKRYGDVESFKYNNFDYYYDGENFYQNKDSWEKVENPYLFYSFLSFDEMPKILSSATFVSNLELESGERELQYLISSNSLQSILYDKNTDYDEVPNSITVITDSSDNITKITYQLDSFCKTIDSCKEHLQIEMSFEMFGSVNKIDNPIG